MSHSPVQGLQQDLQGALIGQRELPEHDGAARGALQARLDEVRQQPAQQEALSTLAHLTRKQSGGIPPDQDIH